MRRNGATARGAQTRHAATPVMMASSRGAICARSSSSLMATPIERGTPRATCAALRQQRAASAQSKPRRCRAAWSAAPAATGRRRQRPRAPSARHAGRAQHDDLRLALRRGIGDPVVDAAAPERLVQLAGAVGGEDHHRARARAECRARGSRSGSRTGTPAGAPRTRGRSGRFRRSAARRFGRAQRLQHRPLDQELVAIDVDRLIAGLPDRQHLARIIPFVERGRGIDALVALQPDQPPAQDARMALAASVLPTPGAPSSSSGLPSARAR